MTWLRQVSFLRRLVGGQTTITGRRILRGPRARGWTMGEERLHGPSRASARESEAWLARRRGSVEAARAPAREAR